jgi:hypothetical protein
MSMQMTAPAEVEQREQATTEEPEIVTRGQRTAAKVRIGAATKFLDRSNRLGTTTQERARERLKAATEAFSTGDDEDAHGKKEEASLNFNSALEVATEVETFISASHDSNRGQNEHGAPEENNSLEDGDSDKDEKR